MDHDNNDNNDKNDNNDNKDGQKNEKRNSKKADRTMNEKDGQSHVSRNVDDNNSDNDTTSDPFSVLQSLPISVEERSMMQLAAKLTDFSFSSLWPVLQRLGWQYVGKRYCRRSSPEGKDFSFASAKELVQFLDSTRMKEFRGEGDYPAIDEDEGNEEVARKWRYELIDILYRQEVYQQAQAKEDKDEQETTTTTKRKTNGTVAQTNPSSVEADNPTVKVSSTTDTCPASASREEEGEEEEEEENDNDEGKEGMEERPVTANEPGAALFFERSKTSKGKRKSTSGPSKRQRRQNTNAALSGESRGAKRKKNDETTKMVEEDETPLSEKIEEFVAAQGTTWPPVTTILETVERAHRADGSDEACRKLQDGFASQFAEWRFLLATQHSLLLYGFGSKRGVLQDFAEQELNQKGGGDVLILNGYDATLDMPGVLDCLQRVARVAPQEPSLKRTEEDRILEQLDERRLEMGLPPLRRQTNTVPPPPPALGNTAVSSIPPSLRPPVVQRAWSVARAIASLRFPWASHKDNHSDSNQPKSTLRPKVFADEQNGDNDPNKDDASGRPFYLILHNIDGVGLRDLASQQALATLITASRWHPNRPPAIRLVASVDHVDAMTFLWDTTSYCNFSWIWKEVHTFHPYLEELKYSTGGLFSSSSSSPPCSSSSAGAAAPSRRSQTRQSLSLAPTAQAQAQQLGVLEVLHSLAPRHTEVLKELASLQLQAKKKEIPYTTFRHACTNRMFVTSDSNLRAVLRELVDHGIVVTLRDEESWKEMISIPTRDNDDDDEGAVLRQILEFQP